METVHKTLKLLVFLTVLLVSIANHADPVEQAYRLVSEGQDALNQGKTGKAERAFREALDLFPGWYKPMLGMAVVVMQRGGAHETAMKWAKRAVVLEPNRWDEQLTLARVLEAVHRPETALTHYIKAFHPACVHRDQVRDFACPLFTRLGKTNEAKRIKCGGGGKSK